MMAQAITMESKSQWILTGKQVENHEHLWRDANNSTLAYLTYNDIPGQQPPQRVSVEPAVQACIAAMHEASDAMKSVFGIFAAGLGQPGPGNEGFRTVLARQQQSHTTTYHFYDNLTKAVGRCGNILVETIPTYYSEERDVQLIKQNGSSSNTTINGPGRNLLNGTYGVVVETGPSYSTRRQDSVSHMLEFQAANPNVQLGDIIADESDWPGAKRIANRLRLMLPPEIQQAEQASGTLTTQQQAQQAIMQVKNLTVQLQQAQQNIQLLTQHNKTTDELVKQQHQEIIIEKASAKLSLEKHEKDTEIKKEQMKLDELETELSYRIKMKEIALQEKQMKLEEARLAIEATETMSGMAADVHDRTIEHHDRMTVITAVPKDDTTGLDKNLGGADLDN
jgi:hypothetical protein